MSRFHPSALPILIVLLLLGLATPAHAVLSTTTVNGWDTTTLTAAVGYTVTDAITVQTGSGFVARSVTIERKASTATTWSTVRSVTTSASGAVTLNYPVPSVGTWSFRVSVSATATAGAATSAPRTVQAVAGAPTAITGWTTTAATQATGEVLMANVTVSTDAAYVARTIRVQRKLANATTWTTVGTVATSATGRATVGYAVPGAGVWNFRAYVVPTLTAAGASSATRTVTGTAGGAVLVDGGFGHTCAVTPAGGVKCWGDNQVGQLGDGTTTDSLTPVAVQGLSSGVIAIATGAFHSCALTSVGAVKCWGVNIYGRLGNGTTKNSSVPVQVTGLTSGVISLAAGGWHTCAVTSGGAAKCWGLGLDGRLGNGGTATATTPVQVSGLTTGVVSVTAGSFHTCALTRLGAARCWGYNGSGQLGNGATTAASTSVPVTGLTTGTTQISAGDGNTCAVAAGAVKCWGDNTFSQLGRTGGGSAIPVAIPVLTSGVSSVSTGFAHVCALAAGSVRCWGSNGGYAGESPYGFVDVPYGLLGAGSLDFASATPLQVTGLSAGVRALGAGLWHTCALDGSTTLRCWGINPDGQIGNGSTDHRPSPTAVVGYP